jgi:hypothetical protein
MIIEEQEIVQGEKLQALASITLMTPENIAYVEKYRYKCKYLTLQGSHDCFNEITDHDADSIASFPSLFVFSHQIPSFISVIAPKLIHPYVLISHNSDLNIEDSVFSYLNNNPHVVCWFTQNLMVEHPKAVVLPIGIANYMWGHGDAAAVAAAGRSHNEKGPTTLCYVNFNEVTNRQLRQGAWAPSQHFGRQPNLPFPHYLNLLAKFKFCICPEGNGSDTHRLWEALYVGVVPIVLSSNKNAACWARQGIPLLVVEQWSDVTPELLHSTNIIIPDVLPQLTVSYWRDEIHKRLRLAK